MGAGASGDDDDGGSGGAEDEGKARQGCMLGAGAALPLTFLAFVLRAAGLSDAGSCPLS